MCSVDSTSIKRVTCCRTLLAVKAARGDDELIFQCHVNRFSD
jgi:hypothetical protein